MNISMIYPGFRTSATELNANSSADSDVIDETPKLMSYKAPEEVIEVKKEFEVIAKELKEFSQEMQQMDANQDELVNNIFSYFTPAVPDKPAVINHIAIYEKINELKHQFPSNLRILELENVIKQWIKASEENPKILSEPENDFNEKFIVIINHLVMSPLESLMFQLYEKTKSLYDRLYQIFPYRIELSEEEQQYVSNLPENISSKFMREFKTPFMVNNYIMMPQINLRIPKEKNMTFSIGEEIKTSRVALSLKSSECVELSDMRVNYNHKLKLEYELLQQAILEDIPFKPTPDSLIFEEYKIHLMPKPDFLFDCMILLLQKISQDSLLRNHLASFKVYPNPYDENDSSHPFPMIVIYPLFGKNYAQEALTILFNFFQPYMGMGSHCIPRYNVVSKNPLITYSQGDGLKKQKIAENNSELFNKMFDSDRVHFNQNLGEFKLVLPINF